MIGPVTLTRRVWSCRYVFLRLLLASTLLLIVAVDSPARLARMQLAALPDFDYVHEIRDLSASGRYGEAAIIADHGLAHAPPDQHAAISSAKDASEAARASWLRRASDLARGAALGTGDDASIEVLLGAIAADFFIVGDIRDLLIQATRFIKDGEADPVITALSAIGLVTTLAPEIDWAPSVLKAARKAGALSARLASVIVDAVKSRRVAQVEALIGDVASISKRASPGGAVRLLRLADDPADVARIARYVEREGPTAAAALHLTQTTGAQALKSAEALRSAGKVDEALRIENLLLRSAQKGSAGAAWLASSAMRVLVKPHPLVGLAKALWKGNAAELVERALQSLDPRAWWLLPLLGVWVFLEIALVLRRLAPPRDTNLTLAAPRA